MAYLQLFGSLCEGTVVLKPEMLFLGVSIQLLNARLAAFMQNVWSEVVVACLLQGSSTQLSGNVHTTKSWEPGGEMHSSKVLISEFVSEQRMRPTRNLLFPLQIVLKAQGLPAAPLISVHCWYTNTGKISIFFPFCPKISQQFRGQQ